MACEENALAMRFVGVDLGWKMRPPSKDRTAICILDQSGLVEDVFSVTSDAEIVAALEEPRSSWIGLDAPLIVPNESGMRRCERALFDRGVRVLPCSRSFLTRKFGGCRGEVVSGMLREIGFAFPRRQTREDGVLFEVYPHGFLRSVLPSPFPRYKKGPCEVRRREALRLLPLLRRYEPSLAIPDRLEREIISSPPSLMPAVADKVDSLICVLCLYTHWLYGGKRTELVGDNEAGFILMPRREVIE